MILGCIADDFTGATDLAALLVRAGVPVSLRIGLPERPGIGPSDGVEVVALKIRSVPAEQAVTQALAALDWLRAGGARHVYWKYCSTFDSTARGNIGPVAQALMARANDFQAKREAVATDKGKATVALVDAARERLGRAVFESWDAEEFDTLVRLMGKLADALAGEPFPPAPAP